MRVAGEDRLVPAEDAARYRDALGTVIPPGLPEALLEPVPDPLLQLVRRWARTHGPFLSAAPAARFGLGPAEVTAVLERLASEGRVVKGAFRPGGEGHEEWCDSDVLRILRQRSLAALRREVEPAEAATLARFLPAWHGVAAVGEDGGRAGLDRLVEVVGQLEGLALPASVMETDVLSARVKGYDPRLLDELLVGGEVMWVGAGPIGRDDGRVVLARRDHAGLLLPRLGLAGEAAPDLDGELHAHLRDTLAARGACFFRELGHPGASDTELLEALWDLVWAGEVTCDGFAALRATVAPAGRGGRARRAGGPSGLPGRSLRPRPGSVRVAAPPRGQGRWSLVSRELGPPPSGPRADAEAAVAVASALLERHGVLTRDAVRAEAVPGGFAGLYPVLKILEESGRIRRGYFLAGMGGAQFAVPGAVDRLRSEARPAEGGRPSVRVLAATDPANPFGAALPWPVRGPARLAGAFVVLVDGVASLFVERGGRGLTALREMDGSWEQAAAEALASAVTAGRWRRLQLQRCPEELAPALEAVGFVPGPKGLVRYA